MPFIINSARTRAFRAEVVAEDEVYVQVRNLDKDGEIQAFYQSNGLAASPVFEGDVIKPQLVGDGDPEALALESEQAFRWAKTQVTDALGVFSADRTRANLDAVVDAVRMLDEYTR